MDHLAILRKNLHLLPRILHGEKTIESRWYKTRRKPFNVIKQGDTIYFKESGDSVSLKSTVKNVIQYENLTEHAIYDLLHVYEKELCIDADNYYNNIKDRRYGILIFLENVETIDPFQIDKTGYGYQSAWICIENISKIRI